MNMGFDSSWIPLADSDSQRWQTGRKERRTWSGGTHRRSSADFIGRSQGDIEGQDLIGEPGCGQFFQAGHGIDGNVVQVIDGRAGAGKTRIAGNAGREDSRLVEEVVLVGTELGTDFVFPGHETPAGFTEDVEQGMSVEVDPDQ